MRTRKRFGQHFLEAAWADKVVRAIAPAPVDAFVEIGPGAGILSLRLAPQVATLVGIEIDRDLVAALRPRLPSNASIVQGDILEVDLAGILSSAGGGKIRIAGNLPYNISSPILFRLLALHATERLHDATLMLQREVADRIVATPGSADYGVLSVLVQWHASVKKLLTLPPGAFRPPPAVTSALIRLSFRPSDVAVADPSLFERLVREVFMHRRKTLGNALGPFAAGTTIAARQALAQAGIDHTRRPQTLEIVEIARLADIFTAADR